MVEDLVTTEAVAPGRPLLRDALRLQLRRTTEHGLQRVRVSSARYPAWACIGMLQSLPAFASKEGAAVADAVQVIVWIVLVTFIACAAGGVLYGAFKASQGGESVLKGSARGLLKGLIAFVVVAAASMIVLTAVGVLWVAFSFLYIHVLNPAAGQ